MYKEEQGRHLQLLLRPSQVPFELLVSRVPAMFHLLSHFKEKWGKEAKQRTCCNWNGWSFPYRMSFFLFQLKLCDCKMSFPANMQTPALNVITHIFYCTRRQLKPACGGWGARGGGGGGCRLGVWVFLVPVVVRLKFDIQIFMCKKAMDMWQASLWSGRKYMKESKSHK
jgi:hypothetical protein